MNRTEQIERHAAVLVSIGLRIEPGDRLAIWAEGDVLELTRAVAAKAFAAGADDVDVFWTDFELARVRARTGREDVVRSVPPQMAAMVDAVSNGASFLRIMTPAPAATDPSEAAQLSQHLAALNAAYAPIRAIIGSGAICWCVTACATPAWARRVFPELDPEPALAQLHVSLARALRLDGTDPLSVWADHLAELRERADELTARRYDALRYRGPGTDLLVGLAVGHRWIAGGAGERRGCCPNLPTEEVFTAPDFRRADGNLRFTKPAVLDGTVVDGIELGLRGGVVVEASARQGESALHRFLEIDEGARRLGEVALVPQSSAVAAENLVWMHPLLDENDASHIALGAGIPVCLPDDVVADDTQRANAGLNASRVHHDFVIGSDQLEVFGVTSSGAEHALLRGGEWA